MRSVISCCGVIFPHRHILNMIQTRIRLETRIMVHMLTRWLRFSGQEADRVAMVTAQSRLRRMYYVWDRRRGSVPSELHRSGSKAQHWPVSLYRKWKKIAMRFISWNSKSSPYTTCWAANNKQLKHSGAFTEPGFFLRCCWGTKTAKIEYQPGEYFQLKNKYMFLSVYWRCCSNKN